MIDIFPKPTEELQEAWSDWMEYKKAEFGFKFKSNQSKKSSLKKLKRLSMGNPKLATAILEEAMSNGYRGFFALSQKEVNKYLVIEPKVIKLEKYG